MKPTAYFINVGRGASVDEVALAQALAERRIAGAAVDVFAQEPPPAGHPLYKVDNVIVSPHVSGFVGATTTIAAPSSSRTCGGTWTVRRFLNLVDRRRDTSPSPRPRRRRGRGSGAAIHTAQQAKPRLLRASPCLHGRGCLGDAAGKLRYDARRNHSPPRSTDSTTSRRARPRIREARGGGGRHHAHWRTAPRAMGTPASDWPRLSVAVIQLSPSGQQDGVRTHAHMVDRRRSPAPRLVAQRPSRVDSAAASRR